LFSFRQNQRCDALANPGDDLPCIDGRIKLERAPEVLRAQFGMNSKTENESLLLSVATDISSLCQPQLSISAS
jgi:hypothetical protein